MRLVLFLIIAGICFPVQGQHTATCTYTVYTAIDVEENMKNNALAPTILRTKPLEYTLTVKDNHSFYFESAVMGTTNVDEESLKMRRIFSSGGTELVHYDLKSHSQDVQVRALGELFCITYSTSPAQWMITSEKKTISGYECYKATLKVDYVDKNDAVLQKEVIAYFTPAIPIQAGPLTYTGLPGLVVEIQERSRTIRLTSIRFNTAEDVPSQRKCIKSFDSQVAYERYVMAKRKQS